MSETGEDRRQRLARSYCRVTAAFPGPVHPQHKQDAKDFIDLAGFDLRGDPAAFRGDPWASEVVRHAMKHAGVVDSKPHAPEGTA